MLKIGKFLFNPQYIQKIKKNTYLHYNGIKEDFFEVSIFNLNNDMNYIEKEKFFQPSAEYSDLENLYKTNKVS